MARKMSREELEHARAAAEERAMALAMLVKSFAPERGWRFVEGPRAVNAFLIYVDSVGYAAITVVHDKTRDQLRQLEGELYRLEAEDDGEKDSRDLASLLEALRAMRQWMGRTFPAQTA